MDTKTPSLLNLFGLSTQLPSVPSPFFACVIRMSLANPCGFTQRVAGSTAGVTCKNSGGLRSREKSLNIHGISSVAMAVFKKRIDMD